MHSEAHKFSETIKYSYPEYFHNKTVLEFGSYNINGSIRDLFENCIFRGVDWRFGPDVDEVSLAHEYDGESADVVISTEMLEHDPYWRLSIMNMIAKAKEAVLITCAGPNRQVHCTETGPNNHYKNISVSEIYEIIKDCLFSQVILVENKESNDTYMFLIK